MLNRHVIWPLAMRHGFFCGISNLALLLTVLSAGGSIYNPAMAIGWLITYLFLHRFMKYLRENEGEGFLTFKHAFFAGFAMSFFAFVLYGMALFLIGAFVFPGLLTDARNELLRNAEALEGILPVSNVDDMYEAYERISLGQLAYTESLSKFLGGLFLSLVAALILRKKQPPFHNDQPNSVA
ncbi:MAG: DUF4199 domain-containing protein [Bacteroidia bacterium]